MKRPHKPSFRSRIVRNLGAACLLALLLTTTSAQAQTFAYVTNSFEGTLVQVDTSTYAITGTVTDLTAPQNRG